MPTLPSLLLRRPLPVLAFLALGFLALPAQAQGTGPTLNTTATTTILAPLSLTPGDDLSFGQVVVGSVSGTVEVAPDGTATASPGISLTSIKPTSPLRFTMTSPANVAYSMSVTPSSGTTIVMVEKASSAQITVDNLKVTLGGTPTNLDPDKNVYHGNTGGSGNPVEIRLGATMHLAANQTPGFYTGSYTVTVAYE